MGAISAIHVRYFRFHLVDPAGGGIVCNNNPPHGKDILIEGRSHHIIPVGITIPERRCVFMRTNSEHLSRSVSMMMAYFDQRRSPR